MNTVQEQKATVMLPGFKAEVTKEDDWGVVWMLVVLVLGIYFGIKAINKLFK